MKFVTVFGAMSASSSSVMFPLLVFRITVCLPLRSVTPKEEVPTEEESEAMAGKEEEDEESAAELSIVTG